MQSHTISRGRRFERLDYVFVVCCGTLTPGLNRVGEPDSCYDFRSFCRACADDFRLHPRRISRSLTERKYVLAGSLGEVASANAATRRNLADLAVRPFQGEPDLINPVPEGRPCSRRELSTAVTVLYKPVCCAMSTIGLRKAPITGSSYAGDSTRGSFSFTTAGPAGQVAKHSGLHGRGRRAHRRLAVPEVIP